MNIQHSPSTRSKLWRRAALTFATCTLLAGDVFAQGTSPWENAVGVLQTAFTGTIATGLALVAIVVGGLMFAFGEGGTKRTMAGIIFGVVNLRPSLDRQFLDITIGERIATILTDGTENNVRWEMSPLEDRRSQSFCHGISSKIVRF